MKNKRNYKAYIFGISILLSGLSTNYVRFYFLDRGATEKEAHHISLFIGTIVCAVTMELLFWLFKSKIKD